MRGLSNLMTIMMAAGDVGALDAHDPGLAHAAVAELARTQMPASVALLHRFEVTVRTRPDPEVGVRVLGLTRATWDAVTAGLLDPVEDGNQAWFVMSDAARERLSRELRGIPAGEAECLYRLGADWAAASTARKKLAIAVSWASIRVLSLA